MKRRNLPLGVLLSILLPTLNMANNNAFRGTMDYPGLLLALLVGSLFLFAIWALNEALSYSRFIQRLQHKRYLVWTVYIVINGVCIAVMRPVLQYFSPFHPEHPTPAWVGFLRMGLAVILVRIVQSALRAKELREAVTLQNQQLLHENLQSRFDALRQQVNPHFLFNSLSTLMTMVRPDNPAAEQFILHLSDVYRQLLSRKESATVSITEELEFLKSYLYMLEARFEDMLCVSIAVPPEEGTQRVPSFCLQLLVENCIKHNVVSQEYPLTVEIYTLENRLFVSNVRQPKTAPPPSSGTGLANLRKRYELLGVENGVSVYDTDERFVVSLTFVGV